MAVLLIPAAACSTQMNVTLIEPETPLPVGLDTYAVAFAWDGGHWDASVQYAEGSVHLSPPRPPGAFDLEVLGLAGGQVTWRGLARGVSPDNLQPSLFFGAVGAFSSFSHMPANVLDLAGSSASPMGPGQVLMVGGSNSGLVEQLAWVYDHPSASFLTSPPPLQPRGHHLALPLLLTDPNGDSDWLLAGGESPDGFATAGAEIYSRHFGGASPSMLPVAQLIPVGSLIDAAGTSAAVGCGVSADGGAGLLLFTPGSGFEPLPPFSDCGGGQVALIPDAGLALMGFDGGVWLIPAFDAGATWVASLAVTHGFRGAVYAGGLVVIGGVGQSGVTGDVRRLFPDLADGGLDAGGRADFAVLPLDGGRLLVVGGRGEDGGALASAEMLDLSTLTSQQLPSMQKARIWPALSDIPGYGAALVVSGEDENGQPAGGFEVFTYP
jgi:hypothetical protein